jgi:acyl-CoA synthetase (AMP-forming)/AMP-acid ligase II
VKLRGFRIELGEIEARLAECAGVREAVVLVREDRPATSASWPTSSPTARALPAPTCARSSPPLPEHMLPSAFVQLDALPVNTNGKLDRKALPGARARTLATREFEPPQGALELAIARSGRTARRVDASAGTITSSSSAATRCWSSR